MMRKRRKSIFSKLTGTKGLKLDFDLDEEVIREIIAIGWIVVGLIIFLAEFNAAGLIGQKVLSSLRYLIGLVAYSLPLIFIWIGLAVGHFFGVSIKFRTIVGLALLLFSTPIFLHLFSTGDPLAVAKAGLGGGVLGFLLSLKFSQIIGGAGTFILTLAIMIVGILTIFNLPLSQFIKRLIAQKGDSETPEGGQEQISLFSSVKRTIGGLKDNIRPARAKVMEMPSRSQSSDDTHLPAIGSSASFVLPQVDLLETSDQVASAGNIAKNAEIIQKTLKDFSISVTMSDANVGPTVTQYTMKPAEGVKLNQITARANDLALALAAKSIRIEAPIPGKSAVGVEIPNKVAAKVTLREVLESKEYSTMGSFLSIALGRDVAGAPMVIDLEKMPHLLIAGATGSGKSVCINTVILSFLMKNSPAELRFIMVDPKRVELTNYNGIPHLLSPVVTEVDKTIAALKWTVAEMDRRYRIFSDTGKRNIVAYNAVAQEKMPYIVFIIDELADLMAASAREVEGSIVRLAQMARATGIHLIVATQRPSVDVITGLIKANITSRIAFAVASNADSRTILDQSGAEKLLGNGDMLYIGNDLNKPRRIQGSFSSDRDIQAIIKHVSAQDVVRYNAEVTEVRSSSSMNKDGNHGMAGEDALYNEASETVAAAGKASASLLQRRLRIGYARAARLLDLLEDNGVIGPADGAKPREVYTSRAEDNQNSF